MGDGYGGRSEVGWQSTRSRRFHRVASYSYHLLCRTSPETVKSSSKLAGGTRVWPGDTQVAHRRHCCAEEPGRNLGRTLEEPGKNLRLRQSPREEPRARPARSRGQHGALRLGGRGLYPLLHRAKARGPISGRAVEGRWSTVSRAWRQLGTAKAQTVRLAQFEGGCDGVNSEHRDGEGRQESS